MSVIIVTGSVLATPETLDEILAASLAHVSRSRGEAGCLAHGVYRDCEEPLRLFFYEEWTDREALDAHFRVPGSSQFVEAVTARAAVQPTITIRETTG
jgi:quinol monooxygenase YgiN